MSSPEALWQELQDPALAPARLQQIAIEAPPEYLAAVAAHPRAYPELLDWIAQYGDAAAQAAVAAARGGMAETSVAASAPAPLPAVRPAAPTAAPAPQGAPAAPPAGRGRRILGMSVPIFSLAVAGAVLVAGGGVSAAVLVPMLSAPQSPTAVAERMVGSLAGLDPLALVGVVAPSEAALFTQPMQALQQVQTASVDPEAARSVADALGRLRSAVQVSTSGLRFVEEEIVRGQVSRVTLVEGTITIAGDEQRVADALYSMSAVQLRAQYESWGYSPDEIDDLLRQVRESIADSIDLPQVLRPSELLDQTDGRLGFEIVTVREGNGWYLSPMLTIADYAYLSDSYRSDQVRLGAEIPAGIGSPTPEEAWQRTLEAAGDATAGRRWLTNLAATLPLPERRLIAIYGPAFAPDGDPYQGMPSDAGIELDARFGDVRLDGSVAYLGDWDVQLRLTRPGDELTFRVQGLCADMKDRYGSHGGCLDDLIDDAARSSGSGITAADLGLHDLRLVAVNGGGGWQASVVGTVGDALTRISNAVLELSRQGRLDGLCGLGYGIPCL